MDSTRESSWLLFHLLVPSSLGEFSINMAVKWSIIVFASLKLLQCYPEEGAFRSHTHFGNLWERS